MEITQREARIMRRIRNRRWWAAGLTLGWWAAWGFVWWILAGAVGLLDYRGLAFASGLFFGATGWIGYAAILTDILQALTERTDAELTEAIEDAIASRKEDATP